jgi:ribosomal protein S18 acetylase RimI-like enzyme
MRGPLRGYIQTVCVAAEHRGRGIGTDLVRWAERRIRRDSPHVFLCVSSFNSGAQRLYERLGYRAVGRLPDDEERRSVGRLRARRPGMRSTAGRIVYAAVLAVIGPSSVSTPT